MKVSEKAELLAKLNTVYSSLHHFGIGVGPAKLLLQEIMDTIAKSK